MRERVPIRRGKHAIQGGYVEMRKIAGPHIDATIDKKETAFHESAHVIMALLVGIGVIEATDRPGPGYHGYTMTQGGSAYQKALVCAAAEAEGCDGTGRNSELPGSDMWRIRQLGYEPDTVVHHARSLLSDTKHQEKIAAVATTIKETRTISGSEAAQVADTTRDETRFAISVFDSRARMEDMQIVTAPSLAHEVEFEIPREIGIQESDASLSECSRV